MTPKSLEKYIIWVDPTNRLGEIAKMVPEYGAIPRAIVAHSMEDVLASLGPREEVVGGLAAFLDEVAAAAGQLCVMFLLPDCETEGHVKWLLRDRQDMRATWKRSRGGNQPSPHVYIVLPKERSALTEHEKAFVRDDIGGRLMGKYVTGPEELVKRLCEP